MLSQNVIRKAIITGPVDVLNNGRAIRASRVRHRHSPSYANDCTRYASQKLYSTLDVYQTQFYILDIYYKNFKFRFLSKEKLRLKDRFSVCC